MMLRAEMYFSLMVSFIFFSGAADARERDKCRQEKSVISELVNLHMIPVLWRQRTELSYFQNKPTDPFRLFLPQSYSMKGFMAPIGEGKSELLQFYNRHELDFVISLLSPLPLGEIQLESYQEWVHWHEDLVSKLIHFRGDFENASEGMKQISTYIAKMKDPFSSKPYEFDPRLLPIKQTFELEQKEIPDKSFFSSPSKSQTGYSPIDAIADLVDLTLGNIVISFVDRSDMESKIADKLKNNNYIQDYILNKTSPQQQLPLMQQLAKKITSITSKYLIEDKVSIATLMKKNSELASEKFSLGNLPFDKINRRLESLGVLVVVQEILARNIQSILQFPVVGFDLEENAEVLQMVEHALDPLLACMVKNNFVVKRGEACLQKYLKEVIYHLTHQIASKVMKEKLSTLVDPEKLPQYQAELLREFQRCLEDQMKTSSASYANQERSIACVGAMVMKLVAEIEKNPQHFSPGKKLLQIIPDAQVVAGLFARAYQCLESIGLAADPQKITNFSVDEWLNSPCLEENIIKEVMKLKIAPIAKESEINAQTVSNYINATYEQTKKVAEKFKVNVSDNTSWLQFTITRQILPEILRSTLGDISSSLVDKVNHNIKTQFEQAEKKFLAVAEKLGSVPLVSDFETKEILLKAISPLLGEIVKEKILLLQKGNATLSSLDEKHLGQLQSVISSCLLKFWKKDQSLESLSANTASYQRYCQAIATEKLLAELLPDRFEEAVKSRLGEMPKSELAQLTRDFIQYIEPIKERTFADLRNSYQDEKKFNEKDSKWYNLFEDEGFKFVLVRTLRDTAIDKFTKNGVLNKDSLTTFLQFNKFGGGKDSLMQAQSYVASMGGIFEAKKGELGPVFISDSDLEKMLSETDPNQKNELLNELILNYGENLARPFVKESIRGIFISRPDVLETETLALELENLSLSFYDQCKNNRIGPQLPIPKNVFYCLSHMMVQLVEMLPEKIWNYTLKANFANLPMQKQAQIKDTVYSIFNRYLGIDSSTGRSKIYSKLINEKGSHYLAGSDFEAELMQVDLASQDIKADLLMELLDAIGVSRMKELFPHNLELANSIAYKVNNEVNFIYDQSRDLKLATNSAIYRYTISVLNEKVTSAFSPISSWNNFPSKSIIEGVVNGYDRCLRTVSLNGSEKVPLEDLLHQLKQGGRSTMISISPVESQRLFKDKNFSSEFYLMQILRRQKVQISLDEPTYKFQDSSNHCLVKILSSLMGQINNYIHQYFQQGKSKLNKATTCVAKVSELAYQELHVSPESFSIEHFLQDVFESSNPKSCVSQLMTELIDELRSQFVKGVDTKNIPHMNEIFEISLLAARNLADQKHSSNGASPLPPIDELEKYFNLFREISKESLAASDQNMLKALKKMREKLTQWVSKGKSVNLNVVAGMLLDDDIGFSATFLTKHFDNLNPNVPYVLGIFGKFFQDNFQEVSLFHRLLDKSSTATGKTANSADDFIKAMQSVVKIMQIAIPRGNIHASQQRTLVITLQRVLKDFLATDGTLESLLKLMLAPKYQFLESYLESQLPLLETTLKSRIASAFAEHLGENGASKLGQLMMNRQLLRNYFLQPSQVDILREILSKNGTDVDAIIDSLMKKNDLQFSDSLIPGLIRKALQQEEVVSYLLNHLIRPRFDEKMKKLNWFKKQLATTNFDKIIAEDKKKNGGHGKIAGALIQYIMEEVYEKNPSLDSLVTELEKIITDLASPF